MVKLRSRLSRGALLSAAVVALAVPVNTAATAAPAPTATVAGGTSSTAVAATASAPPTRSAGRHLIEPVDAGPLVDVAACPSPGQRAKTANDPRIFLREPGGEYYLIPNQTIYFRLWDTFAGVVTNNSVISCANAQGGAYDLNDTHLGRTADDPRVYIYDGTFLSYRWIVSRTVFDKYGFSWGKIRDIPPPLFRGPDWY